MTQEALTPGIEQHDDPAGLVGPVDLVVVGGGPAGLSAAKIAARSRRSVLVIDAGRPRNGPAAGVHNYLYAEGVAPARLEEIGRAEATSYGVEVCAGRAAGVGVVDDPPAGAARFVVTLELSGAGRQTVGARRLLLATGTIDVLPEVPGLREGWGRDVLHCPFCHGWEVRDRAIGVLASGPLAMHQVHLFRALSDDVTVFWHDGVEATDDQREQLAALGVASVVGRVSSAERADGTLVGVRLADGRLVPRDALVVSTGLRARDDLLVDLGLELTDLVVAGTVVGTRLETDATGATLCAGVWAAGNLTDPLATVAAAAAAGGAAGAAAHVDLIREDTTVALAAHRRAQDEADQE
jgi:thioredoxin reductase